MPFKSKTEELDWEREWRKRNPEKIKEYKRRDYLKRKDYIKGKIRGLIALRKGKLGVSCEICGEARTIDRCHIVPLHNQGPNIGWNILFLCPTHHSLFDWDRELLTQEEWVKIKGKVAEAQSHLGIE